MARRANAEEYDKPFDRQQLAAKARGLSQLASFQLIDRYKELHAQVAMTCEVMPSSKRIQELVLVWKILWKGRGGGRRAKLKE